MNIPLPFLLFFYHSSVRLKVAVTELLPPAKFATAKVTNSVSGNWKSQ